MVKRRLAVTSIALGALAAACQLVAGIERVDKEAPPAVVPDADDLVDAGPVVDPCPHVRPPPPPAVDDDRDTKLEIVMAVRTLRLGGEDDAGAPLGFDLDGVCTCDTREGAAFDGGPSCTPRGRACDSDGGVDNVSSSLFDQFAIDDIDDTAGVNDSIAQGKEGILVYVADYNGKANDAEVQVGIMVSYGLLDPSGCGSAPSGSSEKPTRYEPAWCGHDKWSYTQAAVFPGKKIPIARGKGWVTDHQLAFASDLPAKVFLGDSTLAFGSPIAAGPLTQVDRNGEKIWQWQGVLAGRISSQDLLEAAGALKVPHLDRPDGAPYYLCETPLYQTSQTALCDAVDIPSTNAFDFKAGACDAISTAVAFTAEQSEIGDEFTQAPPVNACSVGQPTAPDYGCPDAGP